jgi:hypothetical protein
MTKNQEHEAATQRLAGLVLVAAAVGTIIMMSQHPENVHEMGGVGNWVHGAMIALMATLYAGFAFLLWRIWGGSLTLAIGLAAYAISLGANVAAATINGAIVPALAARGHGAVNPDIFVLAWESNQALATLGVYATGAAFLAWSAIWVRESGWPRIWSAVAVIAAIFPAYALSTGLLTMDLHGALIIYFAHAIVPILFGLTLALGRYPSR